MKTVFIVLLVLVMQSAWAQKDSIQLIKGEGKVFLSIAEVQPQFPGGMEAYRQFLYSNLSYPAISNSIEGNVYVKFLVYKDGTLSDFKVARGLHPDLDAEALRVLKLMPNWSWESYKGSEIPEKILFTMPVKFQITK